MAPTRLYLHENEDDEEKIAANIFTEGLQQKFFVKG